MPNFSASTGTRSSTPWNSAAKSSSGGSRSGTKPKQRIPRRAKAFASVPPDSMYGTVRASGSAASSAAFIASTRSTVEGGLVRRQLGDPFAGDVRADQLVDLASNSACRPGSTRQSTTASAVAGMTLAL